MLSFCPRCSLHIFITSGRQARCSSGVPWKFGNGSGGSGSGPWANEAFASNNEPARAKTALRIIDVPLCVLPGDDALPFHPCQSCRPAKDAHDTAAALVDLNSGAAAE